MKPPPTTFFSDNLAYITNVCNAYVGENVVLMAHAIAPAAFALLGLYVILWGVASMRGMIQEPLTDMVTRLAKITVILTLGTGLAAYNMLITDTFIHGPDQIVAAMAGGQSTGGVTGSLDILMSQGFQTGQQLWAKAGILNGDPGMYVVAVAAFAMTMAVTCYAFFLIAVSKVAMALLVGIGALFIYSLLFEATKNYFSSWIQQMGNYLLVPILVVAVNLLLLKLFGRAAEAAIAGGPYVDQVFPFLSMGVVCLLALASVLTIASGLAGGVSLSTFGAGRMALGAMKQHGPRFVQATGKGSWWITKGVGKGVHAVTTRPAWNAYKNRNKNSISRKS